MAVAALLVSAALGVAVSGTGSDTVAPDFGAVPACHIEAYPSTTTAAFTCTTPVVTDATTAASDATKSPMTPEPTLPGAMMHGTHTITWTGAFSPAPNTTVKLPVGNHKVTWTAADTAGNTATTTQLVIVSDTRPPVFDPEPMSEVGIRATKTVTKFTAPEVGVSATDASGTLVLKSHVSEAKADVSTAVVWTARDTENNVARVRQAITAEDRDPPRIIPENPPAITLETSGTYLDITSDQAGVRPEDHGKVDPNPRIKPSPARLNIGPNVVTWTARDSADHTATATQNINVIQFKPTSLAFKDNGVEITFPSPVDDKTLEGILINKWEFSRHLHLGPQGMTKTISTLPTNDAVVRIVPDLGTVDSDDGFCAPSRTDPTQCQEGSLIGPWVISLPGTLASAQGTNLYEGTAPTLKKCSVHVPELPYWKNHRGIGNVPGCVGYFNVPSFPSGYTGNPFHIWPDPAPGSSSPAAPPPRLPLRLSASLQAGTDGVTLDWTVGSLPAAAYAVERSVGGGTFAAAQTTAINATVAMAPITPTDLGSTLSYRIAETAGGVTVRSDPVTVTLPSSLEAPSGLSAARSASGSSIELDWRDAPIASGYYVEMAGTGGAFERIATVTESNHTVEPGASAAGTREFRVVAYLGGTSSPPSTTASVNLPSP